MPEVGCGDHYRVDVRIVERLLPVFAALHPVVLRHGAGALQIAVVQVADRADFDARYFLELLIQVIAAGADADDGEPDRVVGAFLREQGGSAR